MGLPVIAFHGPATHAAKRNLDAQRHKVETLKAMQRNFDFSCVRRRDSSCHSRYPLRSRPWLEGP